MRRASTSATCQTAPAGRSADRDRAGAADRLCLPSGRRASRRSADELGRRTPRSGRSRPRCWSDWPAVSAVAIWLVAVCGRSTDPRSGRRGADRALTVRRRDTAGSAGTTAARTTRRGAIERCPERCRPLDRDSRKCWPRRRPGCRSVSSSSPTNPRRPGVCSCDRRRPTHRSSSMDASTAGRRRRSAVSRPVRIASGSSATATSPRTARIVDHGGRGRRNR